MSSGVDWRSVPEQDRRQTLAVALVEHPPDGCTDPACSYWFAHGVEPEPICHTHYRRGRVVFWMQWDTGQWVVV